MSKHRGDSQDAAEHRQRILAGICEKYMQKSENPSDRQLLDDLKKTGYRISRATLYRDKTEIFRGDRFVEDIAGSAYSHLIHKCFDNLEFVDRKAREVLNKKWTNSKVVTKQTENGEIIEKTVTEEISGPHIQALRMILDTSVSVTKLLSGDSLLVSASMWARHVDKLEQEIEKLKNENQDLKDHMEKLQNISN